MWLNYLWFYKKIWMGFGYIIFVFFILMVISINMDVFLVEYKIVF